MAFRIHPMVVHELSDGEAVIIHLGAGFYYNVDRTGAVIWNLVTHGKSEDEIINFISEQTKSELGQISEPIIKFLEELQKEDLIAHDPTFIPPVSNGKTKIELPNTQFHAPVLNKYTDMKDFFQADPIHDVDDQGWPHLKPNADIGLS